MMPSILLAARASRTLAFGLVARARARWRCGAGRSTSPALRDLGADFAPMSPAAALAFLLLAASFLAAERRAGAPRAVACTLRSR